MNETKLIARQLQREIEQGKEARERLTRATRKAEDKAYASSTVYGQTALRKATDPVSKVLKERLKVIGRGRGAVDAATVYAHLKEADLDIITVLTLKVALDVLGQEKSPRWVEIAIAVGKAIEMELRLSWYRQQDPDLYRRVEKKFHSSTGTGQKGTVIKFVFNKKGLEWKPWPRDTYF